jgi:hypothetical protein
MLGREISAPFSHFALSLFLFAASMASAHLAGDVREAGFSRVKVVFRTRAWRDDPAALPALTFAQHVEFGTTGNGAAVPAAGLDPDGE